MRVLREFLLWGGVAWDINCFLQGFLPLQFLGGLVLQINIFELVANIIVVGFICVLEFLEVVKDVLDFLDVFSYNPEVFLWVL